MTPVAGGVGRLDGEPRPRPFAWASPRVRDALVLAGLLLLAAALRLPDLATRGVFDGDQGFDALTVRGLVRDGVVPLLGPSTSIGDFHHGAAYYYLLGPAGLPSAGDDPIALALAIAALGIAAVAATWWLARSIGGPLAGAVAGGLLAVSTGAVDGATFIWNPNPIPLFAALALGSAWRAAATGRARWWLAAGLAQGVVQQLHVLGIVGVVPLVVLWVAAWRRAPAARPPLLRAGLAALGVVAILYLPLAVHELRSGFGETRAALDWLAATVGGADGGGPSLVVRLLFVPLRIVAWPLAGPILDALAVAVVAVIGWAAVIALGWMRASGPERRGLAWLAGSVAASALILAAGVRALGGVTPLPNDHYHAFLWPAIAAAAGVAVAVLARAARDAAPGRRAAALLVGGLALAALGAWNLATQPPRVAADGGWPAAHAAAERVLRAASGDPVTVLGVPAFKKTAALDYPLTVLGSAPLPSAEATRVAVLCDALFEEVVGRSCAGGAESARLAEAGIPEGPLLDRFEAAPGRWVSVYEIAGR